MAPRFSETDLPESSFRCWAGKSEERGPRRRHYARDRRRAIDLRQRDGVYRTHSPQVGSNPSHFDWARIRLDYGLPHQPRSSPLRNSAGLRPSCAPAPRHDIRGRDDHPYLGRAIDRGRGTARRPLCRSGSDLQEGSRTRRRSRGDRSNPRRRDRVLAGHSGDRAGWTVEETCR